MLNSEHCCRNEEVLLLDDEFPIRLVTALEREKREKKNLLGMETEMSETKSFGLTSYRPFLCRKTFSRTGKTRLKFLCKM